MQYPHEMSPELGTILHRAFSIESANLHDFGNLAGIVFRSPF
jgi:hypothetical protein